MRVALLSYAYEPSVGGIETVSALVAAGLRARGHSVTVVTRSAGTARPHLIRVPNSRELITQLREADVVLQSHTSLRLSWPLTLGIVRKPRVAVIHGNIRGPGLRGAILGRIKEFTLPRGNTYAVSQYVRSTAAKASGVLANPYQDDLFCASSERNVRPLRELLFVGRLVSAKGLDVAIRALAELRTHDARWSLTVVGDGPERKLCEALAEEIGVGEVVDFAGWEDASAVQHRMATHPLIVVPSRPQPPEAFGVVVIEAIAAGAVPVVARQGGLEEAAGPCGVTFASEDPDSLAQVLTTISTDPSILDDLRGHAGEHLRRFRTDVVAEEYEAALVRALGGTG